MAWLVWLCTHGCMLSRPPEMARAACSRAPAEAPVRQHALACTVVALRTGIRLGGAARGHQCARTDARQGRAAFGSMRLRGGGDDELGHAEDAYGSKMLRVACLRAPLCAALPRPQDGGD